MTAQTQDQVFRKKREVKRSSASGMPEPFRLFNVPVQRTDPLRSVNPTRQLQRQRHWALSGWQGQGRPGPPGKVHLRIVTRLPRPLKGAPIEVFTTQTVTRTIRQPECTRGNRVRLFIPMRPPKLHDRLAAVEEI